MALLGSLVDGAAELRPDDPKGQVDAGDARQKQLERELEWAKSSPRARMSKSKARLANIEKLQEQVIEPVGGLTSVRVDVRVLAATNRNLQKEVEAGQFREDLYYRLNVIPIRVPSLRERREDIPDLIHHFTKSYSAASGQPMRKFAEDAIAVLQAHDWPGNVRQLRNSVERMLILAGGDPDLPITADLLPADVGASVPSMPGGQGGEKLLSLPLREARELFERDYLVAQINRFGGNISRTAEFVGMERSALHRKLKSLSIES